MCIACKKFIIDFFCLNEILICLLLIFFWEILNTQYSLRLLIPYLISLLSSSTNYDVNISTQKNTKTDNKDQHINLSLKIFRRVSKPTLSKIRGITSHMPSIFANHEYSSSLFQSGCERGGVEMVSHQNNSSAIRLPTENTYSGRWEQTAGHTVRSRIGNPIMAVHKKAK